MARLPVVDNSVCAEPTRLNTLLRRRLDSKELPAADLLVNPLIPNLNELF